MSKIFDQSIIEENDSPEWKEHFTVKQFNYIKHVVNGFIRKGEFDEVSFQYSPTDATFHIYEPFTTLNYLGYSSPSVVSIKFESDDKITFLTGDDNGIEILSNRLTALPTVPFPKNLSEEICFWHFVDNIGDLMPELW